MPDSNHSQSLNRDVQTDPDTRGVRIHSVGISDLRFPLRVTGIERVPTEQAVTAMLELGVDLRPEVKGIHMSRLVEDLLAQMQPLHPGNLCDLARRLKEHQQAERASVRCRFDYFLPRTAPVSFRTAPQAYACEWALVRDARGDALEQAVTVPVTTLCPCSKEISARGAHNQRGLVDVRMKGLVPDAPVFLAEVIEAVEQAASAPLFPLLKRVDERHVTELAYDQPRFVEDLVRNVAVWLRDHPRIPSWSVRVTNHESIHQHNAFAEVVQE